MPALPRRRGPRAQVRGGGAHLRNGQGGLVLGALGDLARRGAEVQAVEGHPERVLVEAQGVQEHGLPQVPHGRLQPVRTLLNVRHLHVHLATEQDHEAAGTDSIARARRGCLPRLLPFVTPRTHGGPRGGPCRPQETSEPTGAPGPRSGSWAQPGSMLQRTTAARKPGGELSKRGAPDAASRPAPREALGEAKQVNLAQPKPRLCLSGWAVSALL